MSGSEATELRGDNVSAMYRGFFALGTDIVNGDRITVVSLSNKILYVRFDPENISGKPHHIEAKLGE